MLDKIWKALQAWWYQKNNGPTDVIWYRGYMIVWKDREYYVPALQLSMTSLRDLKVYLNGEISGCF